jgi:hypothetical protein
MSRSNGNGNGNGTKPREGAPSAPPTSGMELVKRTTRIEEEPAAAAAATELMQPPPWLKALRESMAGAIEPSDLKEIMQAQVDKAKQGDERAAKFVFNQAHRMMQAEQQKRLTVIQNNYYDTPAEQRPDTPAEMAAGSDAKIRKMRNRLRDGRPLTDPRDRDTREVSDEEEKELRRRQEAEDEE